MDKASENNKKIETSYNLYKYLERLNDFLFRDGAVSKSHYEKLSSALQKMKDGKPVK